MPQINPEYLDQKRRKVSIDARQVQLDAVLLDITKFMKDKNIDINGEIKKNGLIGVYSTESPQKPQNQRRQ